MIIHQVLVQLCSLHLLIYSFDYLILKLNLASLAASVVIY